MADVAVTAGWVARLLEVKPGERVVVGKKLDGFVGASGFLPLVAGAGASRRVIAGEFCLLVIHLE